MECGLAPSECTTLVPWSCLVGRGITNEGQSKAGPSLLRSKGSTE